MPAFPDTRAGRWGRSRDGAEGPNVSGVGAVIHQGAKGKQGQLSYGAQAMSTRTHNTCSYLAFRHTGD